MKPSTLKKLNLLIEEANALKDKNKFRKAINKFEQALNFINIKATEVEDKRAELENIKNAINQTYSVEINVIIQESIRLTAQKEFGKAKTNLQDGIQIATEKLKDLTLRETLLNDINEILIEIEIEQLLIKGIKLRDEDQNYDSAIKAFIDGLNLAKQILDPNGRVENINRINKEVDIINEIQLKSILQKGTKLKEAGKLEEAIEIFEKSKFFIENVFSPTTKKTEITHIRNLSNEIYSTQIKPLVEKGKELVGQNSSEKAILEFKNALEIAEKMYDSDIKTFEIRLIAEAMNPIYIKQIIPIVEKAKRNTVKDNFNESLTMINETVEIFEEALTIANLMVDSDRKETQIHNIKILINDACLPGVNLIQDRAIQLIAQGKYEEAINEIYIALSIAKLMAYPEDKNIPLQDLKDLVNKIYSAEIKLVINEGKELLNQNKLEKALEKLNDALNKTNKMYFTEEMHKEVNMIKSLIYDVEVKQLISKGKLSDEQELKGKEIEKLNKRLEYAKSIEDEKRRGEEMSKIKKLIDNVHSDEITFLIEQGNQLAAKKAYKEAFEFYEKALKVNNIMAEPDIKNKDLIKESYKRELINKAKFEIDENEYDLAIGSSRKAIEIDDKFIDAYYHIGLAYNYKNEFDAAIEHLQKVLDFDKTHIESLNLVGLAYEAKKDYENALKFLDRTLEIDPNYSKGWYNIGNIYKQIKSYDDAIESYKKATELNPDSANAWFFIGCAYFDKKDYDNAILYLEKAIQIDPKLAQDVNPLLKELKTILEKLHENLLMSFINR
ncbi:MAG: tetratricopeptide repeat protein [Candidatus Hodarchaeales archaeon]|jgi:tetratricopeptide (TPR) repeat protein